MAGYIGSQTPVVSNGSQRKYTFTATAAQTVFTGMDIPNPQQIQVFQNGVRLVITTDYTVSSGTTVTLVNAASAGDSLVVILFADYQLLDQDLSGDFSVDSPTFVIDSTNNRVGVGTVSPSATLDVNGTIKLDGNYPVGTDNVALGDTALDSLTTGTSNVAIGSGALTAGTEADRNIAIGASALSTATTGVRNVAIGHIAGAAISSGSYNTAIGAYSLISNTTAPENTAVGYQAGYSNTTGNQNTFLGSIAGYSNTTGTVNTFLGEAAGYFMTTGSKNVIIGRYSGNQGGLDIRTSNNNIVLSDGDGNPRVSISSTGRVRMSTSSANPTSIYGVFFEPESNNRDTVYLGTSTTASSPLMYFFNPNGGVGNITTSGSSTSFNTSSDYRLKENVVELTGATDRLKQLEPKRFNFIADADTTVDGFLAHEVQSVVPEAISGQKDETKLDEDGNTVPVYQGIDQSKLVPLLVATIKELEARITALETENTAIKARLDALEGN